MSSSDVYREPAGRAEVSLRERGSRFLAYVIPVWHEEEIRKEWQQLKTTWPDATHHCYAAVIGAESGFQRSSDDGEPAGSAGKPILRSILSAGLTNVLVVVVRYFGGTKLGVPGLIQAYGESAAQALQQAGVVEKQITVQFHLETGFEHEQEIHRLASRFGAVFTDRQYDDKVSCTLLVARSRAAEFEKEVRSHYLIHVK